MPRESNVPAKVVLEDIRKIEEFPACPECPGFVRVMVGEVDESGVFIVPQEFETWEIKGEDYLELIGPATDWAPDKPEGTYRNEDLWHFIDLYRGVGESGESEG